VCTVRKVRGTWYTVQQPGYFNLLSTSWRQSPRGSEINILRGKNVSLRKTYFQLLNQTKLSSKNRCDFWKFIISVWCHHYDYSPRGAKHPSCATCYTPFGCTSKPVRLLLCFHTYITRSKFQSTPTLDTWRIGLRFTQGTAGVPWRLKSDGRSRFPSLGGFGNCRAILLYMASLPLVENLEHVEKMKQQGKRLNFSRLIYVLTRTFKNTSLGSWQSH
jgi:hypothetical protein